MIRTLKARTTLWNVLVIASALSLFAVLLYAWLARTLYGHHDGDLREEAKRVLASVSSTTDPIAALQALDKEGAVAPYLMVRDTHGNVVFRSERLAKAEPEIGAHEVLTHAATSGLTVEQFFTVHLARGPVTIYVRPFGNSIRDISPAWQTPRRRRHDAGGGKDCVPCPDSDRHRRHQFWWIPHRQTRTPSGGCNCNVLGIHPGDRPSRRIDPHAPDIEVRRLTSSINQLLDRLGTSFKTMREFTAEVSHQLQTPLTVMKGTIESVEEGTPEDRSKALERVSEEVDALTATLQDLRDFALADADSAEARVGPVIVSEVFAEAGELVGCAR